MKKITIRIESEESNERIENYFRAFVSDNFQQGAEIKVEDE